VTISASAERLDELDWMGNSSPRVMLAQFLEEFSKREQRAKVVARFFGPVAP
jgi:hypothetical protein